MPSHCITPRKCLQEFVEDQSVKFVEDQSVRALLFKNFHLFANITHKLVQCDIPIWAPSIYKAQFLPF